MFLLSIFTKKYTKTTQVQYCVEKVLVQGFVRVKNARCTRRTRMYNTRDTTKRGHDIATMKYSTRTRRTTDVPRFVVCAFLYLILGAARRKKAWLKSMRQIIFTSNSILLQRVYTHTFTPARSGHILGTQQIIK